QGRRPTSTRWRAGADRRTLKGRRSLREDEPIAQAVGDGERRNDGWPGGNAKAEPVRETNVPATSLAYNTLQGSQLHERQYSRRQRRGRRRYEALILRRGRAKRAVHLDRRFALGCLPEYLS